ncbi:unnamed protein product [Coccothraustes coccothraustes]
MMVLGGWVRNGGRAELFQSISVDFDTAVLRPTYRILTHCFSLQTSRLNSNALSRKRKPQPPSRLSSSRPRSPPRHPSSPTGAAPREEQQRSLGSDRLLTVPWESPLSRLLDVRAVCVAEKEEGNGGGRIPRTRAEEAAMLEARLDSVRRQPLVAHAYQ